MVSQNHANIKNSKMAFFRQMTMFLGKYNAFTTFPQKKCQRHQKHQKSDKKCYNPPKVKTSERPCKQVHEKLIPVLNLYLNGKMFQSNENSEWNFKRETKKWFFKKADLPCALNHSQLKTLCFFRKNFV